MKLKRKTAILKKIILALFILFFNIIFPNHIIKAETAISNPERSGSDVPNNRNINNLISLKKDEKQLVEIDKEKLIMYASDYPKMITKASSPDGIQIFAATGRYTLQAIGGSNSYGYDAGILAPNPINVEQNGDTTVYNSSSMMYKSQGKIIKAYLYFNEGYYNGKPVKTNREKTYLEGPKGGKFLINTGFERAAYDVTEFVTNQGEGKYTGGNIDYAEYDGDYAGQWQIVFVEENTQLSLSNVKIKLFDYLIPVNDKISFQLSDKDFHAKTTDNIILNLIITAAGGNANLTGDSVSVRSYLNGVAGNYIKLKEPTRPENNYFRGNITDNGVNITERNPMRTPANIDIINSRYKNETFLTPGLSNIEIMMQTKQDKFTPSFVGMAVSVDEPSYESFAYDKPSKLDTIKSQVGKHETVFLSVKNTNANSSIYDGKLVIQLPDYISYDSHTVKLNNSVLPSSKVQYNEAEHIIEVDLADVQPYEDFTIEYNVQILKGQRNEAISHTLNGKIIYENEDKTEDLYSQNLPKVTYQVPFQVKTSYLDIDKNLSLIPDVESSYTPLGTEKYENEAIEIKGYELVGYRKNDENMIPIVIGEKVVINPVNEDSQICYFYKKIIDLHIRQVILEKNEQLVVPNKGFSIAKNTDLTDTTKQINIKYDKLSDFTDIKLTTEIGFDLYQFVPVIPEYYEYTGFVASTTKEDNTEDKRSTGFPTIDFSEKKEQWLTIYLKPTTESPKPYNWAYQTNNFGHVD